MKNGIFKICWWNTNSMLQFEKHVVDSVFHTDFFWNSYIKIYHNGHTFCFFFSFPFSHTRTLTSQLLIHWFAARVLSIELEKDTHTLTGVEITFSHGAQWMFFDSAINVLSPFNMSRIRNTYIYDGKELLVIAWNY